MPCLFIEHEIPHVNCGGKTKQMILLCGPTLKRSLNGCLGNYNKPFVCTEDPTHLTYCSHSHLISMERLAAAEMTLTNPQLSCFLLQWAAGKMCTERWRSVRSNTASEETVFLLSSSSSLQNISAVLYVLQAQKADELTCFNGRKIKVASYSSQ